MKLRALAPVAAAAAAALTMFASSAYASTFCTIPRTSDGFVALRSGPTLQSRMMARMRVGDEVMAHSETSGAWTKATWWKGGRFKVRREVGYDPPNATGWVSTKLLKEEECG